MKTTINRPSKLTWALLALGVLAAPTAAVADDTEIYLGSNFGNSDVKPNVVFIIDTSGSMSTTVSNTTPDYDESIDYSLPPYSGTCPTDRIYWSSTSSPPDCATTSNYIMVSANKCDAATNALASSAGRHADRFARWRVRSGEDRWSPLSNGDHTSDVECQDDRGRHGDGVDATKLYAADQNDGGPWAALRSKEISWNSQYFYTFYSANYLNYRKTAGSTASKNRLEVIKDVFSQLMDSTADINAAVMRFDRNAHGGYFVVPMQEVNDSTRQMFKDAVNNLTPFGNTPLSETLYEAYRFYRGDSVFFGDSSYPATNDPGVLDPSNTSAYLSPIEYQCQKNFVILLTDGEPTSDAEADPYIQALPGFSAVTGGSTCTNGTFEDAENCLDELAQYMRNKDCSDQFADEQNVITYTVGFLTDQALLSSAASKGGGKYFKTENATQLTDAFTAILTEILSINTSFVAPAVSVNAFNRFTHREELYYALFRPNNYPKWFGNVKRYRLADLGDDLSLVDRKGNAAIDRNTGFFSPASFSFWPRKDVSNPDNEPDGDNVALGGAAGQLELPRNVYTYTGNSPSNVTLTAYPLHEDNANITKEILGDPAMTAAYRTSILQWIRGVDLFDDDTDGLYDDVRRLMGDVIHGRPVLVTYGGTDANPDMTGFVGTNEGYLHAFDAQTGAEQFAFMPKELLPNIRLLFNDNPATIHPYGLDGPLTAWFNDPNENGVVDSGEHVYLYQGMRRGGRNYYALDVTNRSSPVLKWMIQGGSGDFAELGQTWSRPVRAEIKLGGGKTVMIFGGGYDTNQDANGIAEDDSMGRAIYMVDAATGARVWWAGPSGSGADLELAHMTNSIPSEVTTIDLNGDGFVDRFYVGDTRGQVWRFDVDNAAATAGALVRGGVIARIGEEGVDYGARRFYYPPSVSLSGDGTYLNIGIGSGYRAHPLNTAIHDYFFMLRDKDVYTVPATYTTTTLGQMFNATDNALCDSPDLVSAAMMNSLEDHGWYIEMKETTGWIGEKVLAEALTFSGQVMFTTYTPVAQSQTACAPSQGQARAYLVTADHACPVRDFNQSGGEELSREDRVISLTRSGIPPEPVLIIHPSGKTTIMVGTEPIDVDEDRAPEKVYWMTN